MKRILFATVLLLFVAGFTACKKQDEETKPLRSKILGKWRVNKIDVITYTEGTPTTVSTSYGVNDYIDFKDNESDDFELGLGSNRSVGKFASGIDNSLYLDFSAKDLDCQVTSVSDNQLQFTGTVVGSSPRVTETYYLSR